MGYVVGNQHSAEILLQFYLASNFEPILEYCKTAQVFQDIPFSAPGTYRHLDKAFPGSKFILSIRDNPEQWYNSLVRSHAKLNNTGTVPTANELKNAPYIWRGWMWEAMHGIFQTPVDDPYNKAILTRHYETYNQEALDYFKNREKDLLVINLSEEGSYQRFCNFLQILSPYDRFPWENKTG